jgi:hypothetical protein
VLWNFMLHLKEIVLHVILMIIPNKTKNGIIRSKKKLNIKVDF